MTSTRSAADRDQHEQPGSPARRAATCRAANPVTRASGDRLSSLCMAPSSPTRRRRTVDLGPPRTGTWRQLTATRAAGRGWGRVGPTATPKEHVMSDARTHRPARRLPVRAARWSATHPWRAIGGWLAFVAVAVALAAVVPTKQADRRRLPRSASPAGPPQRIDDAGLVRAAHRERADHARPRTRARPRPAPRRRPPRSVRDDGRRCPGVEEVTAPGVEPGPVRRCSSPYASPRTTRTTRRR